MASFCVDVDIVAEQSSLKRTLLHLSFARKAAGPPSLARANAFYLLSR